MRLIIIGVLAFGVAAGACNRAEAPAVASTAPAAASTAPAAAASVDASGRPVATAGRTEPVATVAIREVTIPAGTRLPIVLDTSVGSDTSKVEEAVQAHLSQPIVVHGQTVLAEGSRLSGVVTDATQSGKVKGLAHVAVRFNTLTPRGDDERYTIRTGPVARTASGTKKRDAMEIGIPAAGGAVVGGLLGGKKGAVIGGAAAGGAGTAVVLNQRGKEVRLGKGAALTLRLTEPLTIRVKG
ncbi:MAG: hypothetical protein AUI64_01830 [Acidobacteria bacterium 13_1_40CM_2_64_6]|nr:MAG: hypothetical protein AUH43_23590 [Acidobacteria bacterium 13_1_40CM_65_14]OLC82713.1 MAG: hypothetical protein AUH72_06090 [Acidobacteria bacterium 13_1_40CM_4_65_8]OLD14827.1 MAG: hypothetical protein AUJ01_13320 [Acidobacteria bacterium 13_1_40CM_3_65_5]OLD56710.1 MAG: hypothetical protein AUI64_01830 [Acidobacteria bacterium 13_1_40CM_2_64_6]OLE85639.1 MAG: hypothetical protein AUF76_00235 [Acidobacteria bacterium 13_1_20CM_2_65_9]